MRFLVFLLTSALEHKVHSAIVMYAYVAEVMVACAEINYKAFSVAYGSVASTEKTMMQVQRRSASADIAHPLVLNNATCAAHLSRTI